MAAVHDGGSGSRRGRATARVVFWLVVAVFVAATVTFAVAERRLTTATMTSLQTAAIIVVYFALPTLVVGTYLWMRHGTTSYPSLIAAAVGAFSAVMLATGAYWHCSGAGTPVLTQVAWVGELFFGTAAMPFGDVPGCPAEPPLALGLAQVMALGVLSLAAVKLVLKFSEIYVQRRRIRRARNLVLVAGGGDRVAYADAVACGCEPDTLTVSIGEDVMGAQVAAPRKGVLHLSGQLNTPDLFRSLLGGRRETNLRAIHLIDPDATTNLRRLDAVRDVVGTPPEGRAVRALVRIENPWAAEEWRRNALDNDAWIVDALSSHETTAHELLRQIMGAKHDRLILCGGGSLALAVCEVVSQMEREIAGVAAALADHGQRAPDEPVPDVTLLGPRAPALRENHSVHQRRFGNPKSHFEVVDAPVTREVVEQVAGTATAPVIVFTEPEETMPIEIAARHDQWVIFAFDAGATGIAERALVGKARAFGLALRHKVDEPVSEWERMARRVHEVYFATATNRTRPTTRPWAELDTFYRESNVRQVTNLIGTARKVGLAWGANDAHAPAGSATVTESQAEQLAEAEHTSWLKYYENHGWEKGPRDDDNKKHPSLMPWAELGEEDRRTTTNGVRTSLMMLESFGYVPYREHGWVPWRQYERSGEVRATRLDRDTTWKTDDGQVMTGVAGDWLVTGPDGKQWTVGDEQLQETYSNVAGVVWRRHGVFLARPAVAGERIQTREGKLVAAEGDWIVRDTGDNTWAVPAAHFAANYRDTAG